MKYGERELKIAVVSRLGNAREIIRRIRGGERYDFVEVTACPGGCVCGAGQPFVLREGREGRAHGLYSADRMSSIKRSEENPLMLYSGVLKGRGHDLLHVRYSAEREA